METLTVDFASWLRATEAVERKDKRIAELEAAMREIQGLIPKAVPNYSHAVWEIATKALER